MENNVIAERIKKIRLEHNLTQDELAEIAGVKKATVSVWENGKVGSMKSTSISKMANYFNINPAYLIFEEETRMRPYTEEELSLQQEIGNMMGEMDESQLKAVRMFVSTLLGRQPK